MPTMDPESNMGMVVQRGMASTDGKTQWLMDSGASGHYGPTGLKLDNKVKMTSRTVRTFAEKPMRSTHRGDIGPIKDITLLEGAENVLLSVGKTCDTHGVSVLFTKDHALIYSPDHLSHEGVLGVVAHRDPDNLLYSVDKDALISALRKCDSRCVRGKGGATVMKITAPSTRTALILQRWVHWRQHATTRAPCLAR